MSPYLAGVLLTYAAFLLAVASPGPNVLAVMGTAMGAGRRAGIMLSLGIALGSLSWATLSVLGLSAVLANYASLLIVIKIVGGCYLCWLGCKALRSAARRQDSLHIKSRDGVRHSDMARVVSGYTIMMTNPKAILAWVAITSLGMQQGAPAWVPVAIVAGTFMLSILAHFAYALCFSTPVMVAIYSRARRVLQTLFGGFFLFAGVKLLTDRN